MADSCKIIPKFDDLGKSAKDLLSKNFHFGVLKLESKTKTKSGVEFTVDGEHNPDTGAVVAAIETKGFPQLGHGFSLTEKWASNNKISSTLTNNKLLCGLESKLDLNFDLGKGACATKLKNSYKREGLHSTLDLDFCSKGLNTSVVVDCKGVFLGGKLSYDLANKSLAGSNASLACCPMDSTQLHVGVVDMSKYFAAVHQKFCDKLSVASIFSYTKGASDAYKLELGAQYAVDEHSFYKMKVDCGLNLGCSYVTKISDSVQLTLSSLINGKQWNAGGHKIGMSLNLSV